MKEFFKRHIDLLGIIMGGIFFVGLGFMAQRLLDWDRPCLRFSGVIELHVDGYEEGVKSCELTSRFVSNHLPDRTKALLQSVNQLKRLEVIFPQGLRGVFVTVTDKDPFFLLVSERSLIIGSEVARNQKAFQRLILNAVASQSMSGIETLGKEMRADLLWYLFAGDGEWTDPTTGISVDPKEWLQFSNTPLTVSEYCASPIRQISDLSFCRYELEKEKELPVRKRYQSLISWTAFKILEEEGLSTSSSFLRDLFATELTVAEDPEVLAKQGPLSPPQAEDFVTSEVERLLQTKSDRDLVASVWDRFKLNNTESFDFIVEVDDEQLMDTVVNSLTEWQTNHFLGRKTRVLVVNGENQLELPQAHKVRFDVASLQSETHLVLACELPQIRSIAGLNSNNLIALKVCNSAELPHWVEILKEPSRSQTAQFNLRLHLPSFKRWSQHESTLVASHVPLDRVFCNGVSFKGYPFEIKNCPPQ